MKYDEISKYKSIVIKETTYNKKICCAKGSVEAKFETFDSILRDEVINVGDIIRVVSSKWCESHIGYWVVLGITKGTYTVLHELHDAEVCTEGPTEDFGTVWEKGYRINPLFGLEIEILRNKV